LLLKCNLYRYTQHIVVAALEACNTEVVVGAAARSAVAAGQPAAVAAAAAGRKLSHAITDATTRPRYYVPPTRV
jgi:hypothetical protein